MEIAKTDAELADEAAAQRAELERWNALTPEEQEAEEAAAEQEK